MYSVSFRLDYGFVKQELVINAKRASSAQEPGHRAAFVPHELYFFPYVVLPRETLV